MSEEEEGTVQYVKFGDRPEFKDVQPVFQDDGPFPVCPISYSEQFADTMNYFRAMIQTNERSKRSLQVTTEAILLNPANYTCWYWRRVVLESLNSGYKDELEFVSYLARKHPKNYQIWYHRQIVVTILQDSSNEIPFTAEVLEEDSKNYHSWSHRQWAIKTFNLWDGELDFCEMLFKRDVRNNSSWNQRYFVIFHTLGEGKDLSTEVRQAEIEYAISKIKSAPNNESAWNYLRGMAKGRKLSDFPIIKLFCDEKRPQLVTCSQLLSTLIDCLTEDGGKESLNTAIIYCDTLINGVDDIHKKYWILRKSQLQKIIEQN